MEEHPTGFYSWWFEGDATDAELAEATKRLDPRGKGICKETVARIRYGKTADAKSIFLLMQETGLPFEAFLPSEFLRDVLETG